MRVRRIELKKIQLSYNFYSHKKNLTIRKKEKIILTILDKRKGQKGRTKGVITFIPFCCCFYPLSSSSCCSDGQSLFACALGLIFLVGSIFF